MLRITFDSCKRSGIGDYAAMRTCACSATGKLGDGDWAWQSATHGGNVRNHIGWTYTLLQHGMALPTFTCAVSPLAESCYLYSNAR